VESGGIELILAVNLSIHLCYFFKGVIWLLVATVAGVVPTVSLASFSYIYLLISLNVQVFSLLNLNGTFWSFLETRNID
jgi:chromate transport protein ChrA